MWQKSVGGSIQTRNPNRNQSPSLPIPKERVEMTKGQHGGRGKGRGGRKAKGGGRGNKFRTVDGEEEYEEGEDDYEDEGEPEGDEGEDPAPEGEDLGQPYQSDDHVYSWEVPDFCCGSLKLEY